MTGNGTTRGTSSPPFAPRTMAAASPPERVQIDDGAFVVVAVTGHATDIITGLPVSLQDAVLPVAVISAGMWITYPVGRLYGVALAVAALLSMAGIVVAVDSYGPITDNAGGIAAVSELPYEVRTFTDALDAVGKRRR
ncbi:MAG TPA: sodium/proton-translocating pyrophosphatase [Candidatus Angelobacter sp.]|nr:sodium/proton-translocating pyrophosphatase [Candidatus Angelobacter sp.]